MAGLEHLRTPGAIWTNNFVYVYSADVNTAYDPANRLVLARVPKERIRERDAYEFFVRVEPNRDVIWSHNIGD